MSLAFGAYAYHMLWPLILLFIPAICWPEAPEEERQSLMKASVYYAAFFGILALGININFIQNKLETKTKQVEKIRKGKNE